MTMTADTGDRLAVTAARSLLARWDRQQEVYIAGREGRFDAMFELVDHGLPGKIRVIDLCCGPGSLSERVLSRFPEAEVLAVDFDPVLMRLGQAALGDGGGRLTWLETDLRLPGWEERIDGPFDAVLTTTALHWFTPPQLTAIYQGLGKLIRPGGFFFNGDHLTERDHQPVSRSLLREAAKRHEERVMSAGAADSWKGWWEAIGTEPALAELLALRNERLERSETLAEVTVAFHEAALRQAGFAEVTRIWQLMDDCVLMAVR
ncbi:class I SAM-dependent methyltransferase [Boseaceae bacterium BT-24-1]|nr:class I SAM-dependent methyltransferase [Boseaceae bacterium BT-24-1]